MALSDTRIGAALPSMERAAEWLLFDDVDCLRRWESEQSGTPPGPAFLRDHVNGGWIDARDATLVRGDPALTPMGSGLIAFSSAADADGFAREHGGTRLSWEEAESPREVRR